MSGAVFDRLRSVIAETMMVMPEAIDADSSNETLAGWDSLSHLNLIGAVEKEFAIEFGREEVLNCLSVGALLAAIEAKDGGRTGA